MERIMRLIYKNTSLMLIDAVGLIGGCQSYNSKTDKAISDFSAGNYTMAATEYQEILTDAKGKDGNNQDNDLLLYTIEAGTLYRSAGMEQASSALLHEAYDMLDRFDAERKSKTAQEFVAI